MRADRGGATRGVRPETRERGDDAPRADRDEIAREKRADGRRGRARASAAARGTHPQKLKIAPWCVDGRRSRPSIDRRARRKELSSLPRPDRAPYRSPTRGCSSRRHAHGKIERRAQWRARGDRRLATSARAKIDSLDGLATEKFAVQKTRPDFAHGSSWTRETPAATGFLGRPITARARLANCLPIRKTQTRNVGLETGASGAHDDDRREQRRRER